jgi:hypothetical protein
MLQAVAQPDTLERLLASAREQQLVRRTFAALGVLPVPLGPNRCPSMASFLSFFGLLACERRLLLCALDMFDIFYVRL